MVTQVRWDMLVVRERGRQRRDFRMLPAVIPANLFAASINFVAVSANPFCGEIDQLSNFEVNSGLTFNPPFQLGDGGADGREDQGGVEDKRMALRQGIDEGAVAGDVVQRRAHAPAGSRANAPNPERRRNSRMCS